MCRKKRGINCLFLFTSTESWTRVFSFLVKMWKWMSEEEREWERERDRMSNVFSACHQSHGQDVDVSVISGPNHGSGGGRVVMSKFAGQIHCQMTQGRMTEACVSVSAQVQASWRKNGSDRRANREQARRIKRRQTTRSKMFIFQKKKKKRFKKWRHTVAWDFHLNKSEALN